MIAFKEKIHLWAANYHYRYHMTQHDMTQRHMAWHTHHIMWSESSDMILYFRTITSKLIEIVSTSRYPTDRLRSVHLMETYICKPGCAVSGPAGGIQRRWRRRLSSLTRWPTAQAHPQNCSATFRNNRANSFDSKFTSFQKITFYAISKDKHHMQNLIFFTLYRTTSGKECN